MYLLYWEWEFHRNDRLYTEPPIYYIWIVYELRSVRIISLISCLMSAALQLCRLYSRTRRIDHMRLPIGFVQFDAWNINVDTNKWTTSNSHWHEVVRPYALEIIFETRRKKKEKTKKNKS